MAETAVKQRGERTEHVALKVVFVGIHTRAFDSKILKLEFKSYFISS